MPAVNASAESVVAVTGASGFIGSHVVRALLARGFAVRAVVRDAASEAKTAHLRALAAQLGGNASARLSFASGDLLVDGSFDAAVRGAHAVVHTAAVVALGPQADGERTIVQPSVAGVANVLGACARAGSVRRVVQTSSVAAVMQVDRPDGFLFDESHYNTFSSVENGDPYGLAKRKAEELAFELAAKSNGQFDCVAINPSVVLGPALTKAHTKATPVVIRQCLYGNAVQTFMANFVHVTDVAEAHVEALVRDNVAGKRFILNSDAEPMPLHEIAKPMARLYPQYAVSCRPTISAPVWTLLSWLSYVPVLGGYVLPEAARMSAEKTFKFQNQRSKDELGIQYHTLDEMISDTVESMVPTYVKPKAKM